MGAILIVDRHAELRTHRPSPGALFAGAIRAGTRQLRNTGDVPSQLISRHWVITDAEEQVQEVNGLGVVGHQPLLPPGESFEYTSWATIKTPVGTMRGEYFCVAEDGHRFEAPIPEFALVMPRMLH
jgi:ApaG protein